MKIIGLRANGFRKLSAIELKFNQDGITTIIGDNEQGKTSVLDTIEYLFRGKTMVNDDIIQHGQNKMAAEIDLGEYTVKRIKTKKTDRLEIVNKEGFKLSEKPQAFLDRLINDLTFDPFPFLNKTGEQKLRFMMDFLSLDTAEIDERIKQLETDRLVCGKEGKNLGEAAEVEKVELVDIQVLLGMKAKVEEENNGLIEKARKERDEKVQKAIKHNEIQAAKQSEIIIINKDIATIETSIATLTSQIDRLKNQLSNEKKTREKLVAKMSGLPMPSELLRTDIPVDEPASLVDITKHETDIQKAEAINIKALAYQTYLSKKKAIQDKRNEYDSFTDKIKAFRASKISKFREADTGVKGLEIREDGLYFDDIYSENWSDSQGIKIACDLCISMNPKLRAVFVDRGESFGHKKFIELEAWAKNNDIQIIITKVIDSEPKNIPANTFYILEGKIKEE